MRRFTLSNFAARLVLAAFLCLCNSGSVLLAQQIPEEAELAGILADFLVVDQVVGGKYVALANAIPEDQYSWRPAEGVRSISEVLTHVAQTNYLLAQGAGLSLPADIPTDWTELTEKTTIVDLIERSFALLWEGTKQMASLDPSQPLPGTPRTPRMVVLVHAEHHGEHLGQLIAYARSVDVVPPWSN